jgi:hypothetical protein
MDLAKVNAGMNIQGNDKAAVREGSFIKNLDRSGNGHMADGAMRKPTQRSDGRSKTEN